MTEADQQTITALHVAYVTLIGMPHGEYRATHQMALATVRDELARLTGVDSEIVQNSYERLYPMLSPPGKPERSQPLPYGDE